MGELVTERLLDLDLENQTATTIGGKIYVVRGPGKEGKPTTSIKIFEKTTQTRVTPTVLGGHPTSFEGHSAVFVNNGRILIVMKNVPLSDSFWFLEVDTPFVQEQKKGCDTEVVAWSKGVLGDGLTTIVISGPSGVGKGTLINKLMDDYPKMFGFSVSHTTRAPREKEIDGVHYHFSDRSKMEKDISEGKFLEHALVHGNLYGTSVEAVEIVTDAGKRCILDIDVQGARSVRASSLQAIFIFICPPSFEELESRLRARGTETEEQIQKRLRNARTEMERSESPGLFDHRLVNDDLETCYANLKKLISLNDDMTAAKDLPVKDIELPLCYTIESTKGSEIVLKAESGKSAGSLCTLDLSMMKGGAPGRTRGLKLSPVEPSGIVQDASKEC